MVQLLNTTKKYLKPYLVLVSLVEEVSLVARSEKVNLRLDSGESFTSTDSDSLRLSDHAGYPTPVFKNTNLGFCAYRVPHGPRNSV